MTVEELRAQATAFLRMLSAGSAAEQTSRADDLLLFLYRVRDRMPSAPIAGMDPLLHALEADPDGVFASEDQRRSLTDLLRRLASARPGMR